MSGGSEQAARNVLEGRPIQERVVTSAAVAGGAAVTFRGLGGLLVRGAGGRLPTGLGRSPGPVSAEENLGILRTLDRMGPIGVSGDLARRTGRKLTEKVSKDALGSNDPPPE